MTAALTEKKTGWCTFFENESNKPSVFSSSPTQTCCLSILMTVVVSLINMCMWYQSRDWDLLHVHDVLASRGMFSFLLHALFISIFRYHATVCNFWGDSVWLELDGRGEHGSRLQPGQRRPPEWGQPGEHHQQRSVDHQPAHLVTRFSFCFVPLFGRCEPQQSDQTEWPVKS